MKHLTTASLASAALAASLFVPMLALAQVGAGAGAGVEARTTAAGAKIRANITASTTAETARIARAKDKAAQEIDRRIEALTSLMTRIDAMNKVSDTLKANLKTNVQTQIDGFTALKAKIEADTDLATLKTDIKSITESYRIYMLVLPQGRISAASDRMATIINMMASTGTKLQARINAAAQAGNDTTAVAAALADLGTQLTSAQTHAQTAINTVAPLVPDNGDKTVIESNKAALEKARQELKAGQAAIVAGRKDIATILKGLKGMKAAASASSTTQVSQ